MTSWIKSKISSFIDGIVAGFSGVFGKVSSKVNSGKRSIEIPNTENVDQIDTSTYSKALKARENTINDFASGMRARAYTMYKNSEVNLKLPTIKTEKTNKSNSERPIEVNLNIDKFVNETAQSVDELINEIAFQLKRKALF